MGLNLGGSPGTSAGPGLISPGSMSEKKYTPPCPSKRSRSEGTAFEPGAPSISNTSPGSVGAERLYHKVDKPETGSNLFVPAVKPMTNGPVSCPKPVSSSVQVSPG